MTEDMRFLFATILVIAGILFACAGFYFTSFILTISGFITFFWQND